MLFSRRENIIPEKALQIDTIDNALRNRLLNFFEQLIEKANHNFFEQFVDKMGEKTTQILSGAMHSTTEGNFLRWIEQSPWYVFYDFIEFSCNNKKLLRNYKINILQVNDILEEEKSGYRLLECKIIKVVNSEELEEISQAITSPYDAVNFHFKNALSLYSDRKKPDYANSIKESISAVEAMCCTILGEKSTLGQALKKLEERGVKIHEAQKNAFSALYGYTNDEAGIRHGSMNSANAQPEDAKFMLITCSAFVNYLKEKYSKA